MSQAAGKNITSPQYFGPYDVRLTNSGDVDAILAHMRSKEKSPDQSRREAVYLRDPVLVGQQVADGFFSVLERVAANDRERTILGGERGIVAATGAYPIGLDDTGNQVAIPITGYNGILNRKLLTWEIGSSLYVKENDLPNENGLLPKGCTYDLMVGITTFNLFRLASKHMVEAITANVQNHLWGVIERLTGEYLRWSIIGNVSPQLREGSLITTISADGVGRDSNFKIDKQFYFVTPNQMPITASFLHDALMSEGVSYLRGDVENILDVNFRLPEELVHLITATKMMPGILRPGGEMASPTIRRPYEERSFTEARGLMEPIVANLRERQHRLNGGSNGSSIQGVDGGSRALAEVIITAGAANREIVGGSSSPIAMLSAPPAHGASEPYRHHGVTDGGDSSTDARYTRRLDLG